jgi:hypothetical protein
MLASGLIKASPNHIGLTISRLDCEFHDSWWNANDESLIVSLKYYRLFVLYWLIAVTMLASGLIEQAKVNPTDE